MNPTLVACTKASKLLAYRVEGFHEPLLLSEEQLTADSFWNRESQFSLMIWLLVGGPCSSGQPSMYILIVQTGLTQWIIKRKK